MEPMSRASEFDNKVVVKLSMFDDGNAGRLSELKVA